MLFLKLAIRGKALGYYHTTCLFTPFDQIFRHVTVFECELMGNLFSALLLINTHQYFTLCLLVLFELQLKLIRNEFIFYFMHKNIGKKQLSIAELREA